MRSSTTNGDLPRTSPRRFTTPEVTRFPRANAAIHRHGSALVRPIRRGAPIAANPGLREAPLVIRLPESEGGRHRLYGTRREIVVAFLVPSTLPLPPVIPGIPATGR